MSIHHLFEVLLDCKSLPEKLTDKKFVENLKDYLLPLITTSTYTRRQLLLSAGQVAESTYFLERGAARGFHINKDTNKEITDFLWTLDSFITVPDSFFHQRPSRLFIEVMPGTQLMGISYHDLMGCIEKYPVTDLFTRNLLLQSAVFEAKRNHELNSTSAWDRYLLLLKKYPDIEQQFSKGTIASYLNITPQSLSRMLKNKRHP
ncbi:MAG: hypothetical protein ABIP35_03330 [Ginsengibacter sp.]